MYEDDGESLDYLSGSHGATTSTAATWARTNEKLTLTVKPLVGGFKGLPEDRAHWLQLRGQPLDWMPTAVECNGQEVNASKVPTSVGWWRCGGLATSCADVTIGVDTAAGSQRSPNNPVGLLVTSRDECCAACDADEECNAWIYATDEPIPGAGCDSCNCWPLSSIPGVKNVSNRVVGRKTALPAAASLACPAGALVVACPSTSNQETTVISITDAIIL